jgi:acyl-coenzyme A thioesterase PaaI-like protein
LTLDFVPIHVAPGRPCFRGSPKRRHYNPLGTVHGGWFATLLDSAVGCAIHASLPAGKAFTTLELKVNMVRALTDGVPLVRAEGKVIHVPPGGHRRRAHRGARWQAVRACDHDLPDL